MTIARNKVIWWGVGPPADISREMRNRGLALVVSEEEASLLDRDVRAVLVPFSPRKGAGAVAARAGRLRAGVVNRGGRILVVAYNAQDLHDARIQTKGMSDVSAVDGTEASVVAHECSRIEPGRPVGGVVVESATKTKLQPQDEVLLRRAFSDFKLIRVVALSGGLSDACVWRVQATSMEGRKTMPFLVKAGSLKDMTEEINTTKDLVLDHMPFTNRPGLVEDRCVSGLDRRLLVSQFVEKADRLDDYLGRKRSVEKVIRSIFDGPLRNWRSNATPKRVAQGKVYAGRVRGTGGEHTKGLVEAHQVAQTIDASVASPEAILQVLERFPVRDVHLCQAHGDLHPRNIFVRDNSEEIILIDFAHAGALENPILRDAATLDVALAFDGWERSLTRVSIKEIERLYTPPVFGLNPEDFCHRAGAITYVRHQAKIDAHDQDEYVVALVAMLLRTARLLARMDQLPDRAKLVAVALRCAERLAKTLP